MRLAFLVLMPHLMGIWLEAGQPIVTADLSPGEAWLGDPVTLTVKVHFDDSWEIELLELEDTLGGAHVLSQAWTEVEKDPQTRLNHLTFRAELAWFELGQFELADLRLKGTPESGSPVWFDVPDLDVSVNPMLEDLDASLAPPKGQISLPARFRIALVVTVLAVTLVVIAVAVFFLRRPKAARVVPAEPRLPPLEEALNHLRELTHGSLLKEGRLKPFYVRIDDIIRILYSRVYRIPAEEMTTDELDVWLRGKDADARLIQVNASFRDLCDSVKYARYEPQQVENTEVVNMAHEIIELLAAESDGERHVANG